MPDRAEEKEKLERQRTTINLHLFSVFGASSQSTVAGSVVTVGARAYWGPVVAGSDVPLLFVPT